MWKRKFIAFIVLSGITPGLVYLANIYLITVRGTAAAEPLFPTIQLFSLALDFGLPSFLLVARQGVREPLLDLLSSKIFNGVFVLSSLLILASAIKLSVTTEDPLELSSTFVYLAPFMIVYSYSGLYSALYRSLADRSASLKKGIIVRSALNVSSAAALAMSLLGAHASIVLLIVTTVRFPFCILLFKAIHSEKDRRKFAITDIAKVAAASLVAFAISGFATRLMVNLIFSPQQVTLYAYIAVIAVRISGFLTQASQPFYRNLRRAIVGLDLVACVVSFLAIFSLSPAIEVPTLILLLWATAMTIQRLLEFRVHLIRIIFPPLELAVFWAVASRLNVMLGDSVIRIWIVSQALSLAVLIGATVIFLPKAQGSLPFKNFSR